jgi:HTH-type transcriptional regulator/antitoxin HigA
MIHQVNDLIPAYTPSPGEILKMELDARGWSQRQFSMILGKPAQAVNEILRAKKQITPETALRIAAALGTSPELWLNLEADYRLALARQAVSQELLDEIVGRSTQLLRDDRIPVTT